MNVENDHLWLFRPKPLDDELLSSWLVRCAYANARKLHSFCTQNWGTRHHFWERDLDRSSDIRILSVLSDFTNTSRLRSYSTSLATYEGVLFERFTLYGELPWVMAIGKKGRDRYGFGMQFCPLCLTSDETPYYRRSWRLSCLVVCPVHGCFLHDCCPSCGAPVTFHQSDYGEKVLSYRAMITKCSKCGFDRRSAQTFFCGDNDRRNRLKAFQAVIFEAIQSGWAQEPGSPKRYIMCLPYFNGLHNLVRALCSQSRTGRLRDGCFKEIENEDIDSALNIVGAFDRLRVKERTYVLEMAAWLIEQWPDRFIGIALEANLASSYFFSYKSSVTAYWFHSPIHEHLDRSHYHPSKQENKACRTFLDSNGLLTSKNNIQRWLGRYYVDKSRYT
jgi:hypothetical protein